MTKLFHLWRRTRGSFFANAMLSGATNLILGLLGMGTGVLAARLLGPRGRGELAAIQTWPTFVGYLALLGTGDALVYYSAREPERAGNYLGSALVLSLIASGPFMLVAFLAMPLLLSAQSASVIAGAQWYLLVVPVMALTGLPFYPLRGRADFTTWNFLRTTPILAWTAILLVAWFVLCRKPRPLAYAYLIALTALFLPVAFVVKRRVPRAFRAQIRDFGPLLRYGLPCMMTSVPQFLNFRLDQMLMAGLLSPDALGLYVVAVAWSGAITPLLYAVGIVLFPEVASKETEQERIDTFVRGGRIAGLLAVSAAVALTLATPWGIALLFGANFRRAIPAGLILAPAAAIAGLNQVLEDGLRGLGRPTAVMQAELAGLVVTAVSLALMLRPLGIIGASIASLLGYSAVTLVLVMHSRWLTGTSVAALLFPNWGEIYSGVRRLTSIARRAVASSGG